ncbi:MAG TPA: DUF2752 domain-containing protein [Actinomycetota bacterium]|jgi:hypothetical protein|nr:DUF2752 domain-containing protein [Micrococcales bacterium]HPE12191.1 DUF2752 domain-containing protein [Actinomycetota bacterium]HRV64937.1 DUF2752 domain-containing protein [Candidatus Nanopelagicales bacterium]
MDKRWQRMRAPIATGVAGLAACAYVYAVDPSTPGHYPGCPTKIFTGLDCPFCGSLRATHDLLHGDVVGALSLNAVTVLVILPLIAVAYVLWTYRRWRGEDFSMTFPKWATSALVVLLLVFTVVRNLPGMPLGTTA